MFFSYQFVKFKIVPALWKYVFGPYAYNGVLSRLHKPFPPYLHNKRSNIWKRSKVHKRHKTILSVETKVDSRYIDLAYLE